MTVYLDGSSPSIQSRSRKFVGVMTGLRVVDSLFPVSQGQRELLIGDRQTGKTSISTSTMHAQQYRNSSSIQRKTELATHVSIGQRVSTVLKAASVLVANTLDKFCSSLLCTVTGTMTSQFAGPLTGTSLSELNRNQGGHNYICYDDLSKHAVAYRQLCLYLRKPAGREAFPSDVFYLHARILERSCCLSHFAALGTLMSLPIIETLSNDLSAYIATNVISITDGQLYLDTTLFGIGTCPAISTDKSVSRVGAKSLDHLLRQSGFRTYSLLGDVKQEADSASTSDAAKLRWHRSVLTLSLFTQRVAADRLDNNIVLLSLTTGSVDGIPRSLTNSVALSLHVSAAPTTMMLSSPSMMSLVMLAPIASALSRTLVLASRLNVTVALLTALLMSTLASLHPNLAGSLLSTLSWLSSLRTPIRVSEVHQTWW